MTKVKQLSNKFDVHHSRKNSLWTGGVWRLPVCGAQFPWNLGQERVFESVSAGMQEAAQVRIWPRALQGRGSAHRTQSCSQCWGLADRKYCVFGQAEHLEEHGRWGCWRNPPGRSGSILSLGIYIRSALTCLLTTSDICVDDIRAWVRVDELGPYKFVKLVV